MSQCFHRETRHSIHIGVEPRNKWQCLLVHHFHLTSIGVSYFTFILSFVLLLVAPSTCTCLVLQGIGAVVYESIFPVISHLSVNITNRINPRNLITHLIL